MCVLIGLGTDLRRVRSGCLLPFGIYVTRMANARCRIRFMASDPGIVGRGGRSSIRGAHMGTVCRGTGLGPGCAFSAFIIKDGGGFTRTTSLTITRSPKRVCGPLFLCKNIKLKGARLVRSITRCVLRRSPSGGMLCIADRAFAGRLVSTLGMNGGKGRLTVAAFHRGCHGGSILLVSSVRFVVKGRDARRRFFRAFGRLRISKGRVVVSDSGPPGSVRALRTELHAHFR